MTTRKPSAAQRATEFIRDVAEASDDIEPPDRENWFQIANQLLREDRERRRMAWAILAWWKSGGKAAQQIAAIALPLANKRARRLERAKRKEGQRG